MNNHIKFKDVLARLNENEMPYAILPLNEKNNDWRIVVTQYGGRVLGPFCGENGESLAWINGVFREAAAFRKFVEKRNWNIGGDRFWVAPEHEFFVRQRSDFHGSYCVPEGLDPGRYRLQHSGKSVELEASVDTNVYGRSFGRKAFSIKRTLTPAANPLESLRPELAAATDFCGYTYDVTLSDLSPQNEMPLEAWNLLQVNPGGKILIPYNHQPQYVDYYEPMDEDCIKTHDGYFELSVSGYRRYKAAFFSLNTNGRSIYVNRNEDGYYLIFKQYYNDPTNPYCCDPWDRPGLKGCSVYVYNDNGSNGGYAEYENSLLTIGNETRRETAISQMSHLFYMGEKHCLEQLIRTLLGIEYTINLYAEDSL